MPSRLDLPGLGTVCRSDFSVRLGCLQLDLLHPGVLAIAVIGADLAVFVFDDPD